MIFKQVKVCLSSRIILGLMAATILTNCTGAIKKQYNEIDKKITCKLEQNVFSINNGKIILERIDDNKVSFLISLVSFSFLTDMHTDPKLLFKLYSKQDKVSQELNFKAVSKNWDKSIAVKSYTPENLDYAGVVMDKTTFEKIIHAEKVELLVQTNMDPAKLVLNQFDLKQFYKFAEVCF